MGIHACSSSYLEGWGKRITWTWEAEVAGSRDCTTALQPGWQEWDCISENKNKQQSNVEMGNCWSSRCCIRFIIFFSPPPQMSEHSNQEKGKQSSSPSTRIRVSWKHLMQEHTVCHLLKNRCLQLNKLPLHYVVWALTLDSHDGSRCHKKHKTRPYDICNTLFLV